MDRLLFGDNQFFGVNHMSEEKARAQAMRFQSLDAVIDVLDAAYDAGVRTFMCTTHDRIGEICDHVRLDPERYADFAFYPCMPYAHKYANAVTEDGMLGAVKRFLPDEGLFERGACAAASSMAKKDIEGITTLLIDAEMKMFQGLRTPVVFLQNVDRRPPARARLRRRLPDLRRPRARALRRRAGLHHDEPAGAAAGARGAGHREPDRLLEHQQDRLPHVRRGRGLRADAARAPLPRDRDVGLRLGRDPAAEAIEWVCAQPNLESIVFGASSARNIRQTRDLVARHWDLEPVLA